MTSVSPIVASAGPARRFWDALSGKMRGRPPQPPSDQPCEPSSYMFLAEEKVYSILGDIHGNWQALQAVLQDVEQRGVRQVVCTGDIVGYGADPDRCVDEVRSRRIPSVLGNHDHYCLVPDSKFAFKEEAARTIQWTREHLSATQLAFLGSLPFTLSLDGFEVAHASLKEPEAWEYMLRQESAEASMELQSAPVCFVGHTHIPMAFEKEGRFVKCVAPDRVKLRAGRQYLINVGSVGQPRDARPEAAYAVFDTREQVVSICRVSYDVAGAQARIRNAGLPEKNAARLAVGK